MAVVWRDETAKWEVRFNDGDYTRHYGDYVRKADAERRNEVVRAQRAKRKRNIKHWIAWTTTEIEFVRVNMDMKSSEIAKHLGRTPRAVRVMKTNIRRGER